MDPATHAELMARAKADADLDVAVDLARQTLSIPGGRSVEFVVDDFSRQCLLAGGDQLSYIQQRLDAIETYERSSPNALDTLA